MDNNKSGADLIAAERQRQIDKEGYAPAHDDQHTTGELTEAAICYATAGSAMIRGSTAEEWPHEMVDGYGGTMLHWPWGEENWKPVDDQVRMLAKAGALLAAEIDRIQRMARSGIAAAKPSCPIRQRATVILEDTDDGRMTCRVEYKPDVDAHGPIESTAVRASLGILKYLAARSGGKSEAV